MSDDDMNPYSGGMSDAEDDSLLPGGSQSWASSKKKSMIAGGAPSSSSSSSAAMMSNPKSMKMKSASSKGITIDDPDDENEDMEEDDENEDSEYEENNDDEEDLENGDEEDDDMMDDDDVLSDEEEDDQSETNDAEDDDDESGFQGKKVSSTTAKSKKGKKGTASAATSAKKTSSSSSSSALGTMGSKTKTLEMSILQQQQLPEIDTDDEKEDDENYLQKFSRDVNENYLLDNHPECIIHNYDEISVLTQIVRDKNGMIVDPLHRTAPYLTKYERARVLGQRAKQIEFGAKPLVKLPENVIDGRVIAELELLQKKIPFIIRRPLPNGASEYWNLRDLDMISF